MKAMLNELATLHRDRVTSAELARWLGTTPASVRKDISWTKALGTTSVGGAAYHPAELVERLEVLLSPTPRRSFRTALAGLGDAGLTLAEDLLKRPDSPYALVAGFDSRANRLEQLEVTFPIWPTTDITAVSLRLGLETAILMVPAHEAQKVAERFVQGGVKRLINYSSAVLRLNRRQVSVRECGLYT